MICKKCNYKNKPESTHCEKCQTELNSNNIIKEIDSVFDKIEKKTCVNANPIHNIIQAVTIFCCFLLGGVIGGLIAGSGGAFVGVMIGVVVGLFGSGIAIMIYKSKNS